MVLIFSFSFVSFSIKFYKDEKSITCMFFDVESICYMFSHCSICY